MSRRWFGTDGIRGRAGEGPLARTFLVRLGRALGESAVAADDGRPLVLIARDTRASGPAITEALAAGLLAPGAEVVDLGVLPTPGLPMAMRSRSAQLGIVVSASHNPWEDNGVKLFGPGGHKLTDEQERVLEARVEEQGGEDGQEGAPTASVVSEPGDDAYVEEMLDRFGRLDLTSMRIAVDCAHGAATATAPCVLESLGASVTVLHGAPDGHNINAGCGSTHLDALLATMASGGHDIGLAFDGDADRVLLADPAGRPCTGDPMMGFLGTWFAAEENLPGRTVVATVMSNLGLERLLSEHDIRLLRTAVGDRYVNAAMREGGYGLGGEDSGHLLFGWEHDFTGDGLYTALRVIQGLLATGRDIASVIDAMPAIPQLLRNLEVADKPPVEELERLLARVASAEAEHGQDIRIVLRYSGTERLARVMVEGVDAGVVDSLTDELAALWLDEIAAHGSVAG